jgi:acyl-CoA thioesterase I
MILRHTLPTTSASLNTGRGFITPGRRVFICLLLAPLLTVSCARPSATAGRSTSPINYVALGDSTGIGLGARDGGGYVERLFARIERKRPGSTLVNLSAAGATAADVVNRQLGRLEGAKPTLVTVCVGLNDLLRGHEAKQFARDYETLIGRLKKSGGLIVVANLPDVASAPALKGTADELFRSRLGQFNKAIEEVARRHGVTLVDLYQSSGEMLRTRPEFFSSDGLHPSDLGYAQWAEAMWAVIEQAIQDMALHERESFGKVVAPREHKQ